MQTRQNALVSYQVRILSHCVQSLFKSSLSWLLKLPTMLLSQSLLLLFLILLLLLYVDCPCNTQPGFGWCCSIIYIYIQNNSPCLWQILLIELGVLIEKTVDLFPEHPRRYCSSFPHKIPALLLWQSLHIHQPPAVVPATSVPHCRFPRAEMAMALSDRNQTACSALQFREGNVMRWHAGLKLYQQVCRLTLFRIKKILPHSDLFYFFR